MKEILTRSLSGLLYIVLLLLCLNNEHALIALFFVLGIICLAEFNKLIQLKSFIPFVVFTIIYFVFGYWQLVMNSGTGLREATQILQVITIFVQSSVQMGFLKLQIKISSAENSHTMISHMLIAV